jgi:hypothetical protein
VNLSGEAEGNEALDARVEREAYEASLSDEVDPVVVGERCAKSGVDPAER